MMITVLERGDSDSGNLLIQVFDTTDLLGLVRLYEFNFTRLFTEISKSDISPDGRYLLFQGLN